MLHFYLTVPICILEVINIFYRKQSLNLRVLTTVVVYAQEGKHRALTTGNTGIL